MIERQAARVLLIADGAVLLVKGLDASRADATPWWIAPGGGIDDGETLAAAAVREVHEETGLRLDPADLGPVVFTRVAEFPFEGREYRQHESFFRVAVARFTPESHGWDELEQRVLLEYRWWTRAELKATTETVYPETLVELVSEI